MKIANLFRLGEWFKEGRTGYFNIDTLKIRSMEVHIKVELDADYMQVSMVVDKKYLIDIRSLSQSSLVYRLYLDDTFDPRLQALENHLVSVWQKIIDAVNKDWSKMIHMLTHYRDQPTFNALSRNSASHVIRAFQIWELDNSISPEALMALACFNARKEDLVPTPEFLKKVKAVQAACLLHSVVNMPQDKYIEVRWYNQVYWNMCEADRDHEMQRARAKEKLLRENGF